MYIWKTLHQIIQLTQILVHFAPHIINEFLAHFAPHTDNPDLAQVVPDTINPDLDHFALH